MLLVVLNPKFSFALILGCFISNTTSSLGWYDMVFGTLATIIAITPMCFIRKMPIAAIFPVISNAFIVSLELGIAFNLWNESFWYNVFTIALGFFVLNIILYFAYPMYSISKDEITTNYTMFLLTRNGAYWLILAIVLGLCYLAFAIFLQNKIRLILGIAISILSIFLQIVLGIIFKDALTSFYYYLYFLFPIFSILLSIFTYRNTKTNDEPKEEAS